jgi:gluconokinase
MCVVVILFGVSGAGKTVVGKTLAQELRWDFHDADDFHSATNIEKMQKGIALTDEDRKPWLGNLRQQIERCLAANQSAVLACSALKRKYRDRLRVSDDVRFVFLRGDRSLIAAQLAKRTGHFMDTRLLDTQLADLEEPQSNEAAAIVDLGRSPGELVEDIKAKLKLTN